MASECEPLTSIKITFSCPLTIPPTQVIMQPPSSKLNYQEGSSSAGGDNMSVNSSGQRDEVQEIERWSSRETARVRTWRVLVTVLLTVTGVAVSVSTYILLRSEEQRNFDEAVGDLQRTVLPTVLSPFN